MFADEHTELLLFRSYGAKRRYSVQNYECANWSACTGTQICTTQFVNLSVCVVALDASSTAANNRPIDALHVLHVINGVKLARVATVGQITGAARTAVGLVQFRCSLNEDFQINLAVPSCVFTESTWFLCNLLGTQQRRIELYRLFV